MVHLRRRDSNPWSMLSCEKRGGCLQITKRVALKKKQVEDVLGGDKAWENVARTAGAPAPHLHQLVQSGAAPPVTVSPLPQSCHCSPWLHMLQLLLWHRMLWRWCVAPSWHSVALPAKPPTPAAPAACASSPLPQLWRPRGFLQRDSNAVC